MGEGWYLFCMNRQKTLWTVLIVVIVIVLGVFVWKERAGFVRTPVHATSTTPTSTVTQIAPGVSVEGNGQYTITQLPSGSSVPKVPDYKTPLKCADTVSADECGYFVKAAATVAEKIGKSPDDMALWINLGTLRKEAEDYSGAIVAWNYAASRLADKNPIPYANLGDLYANFLHDKAKAETNYLKAIAIYPQNIDLHVALAQVYKSEGRANDAKAQYDIAISNAEKAGQTDLASAIKAEAAAK